MFQLAKKYTLIKGASLGLAITIVGLNGSFQLGKKENIPGFEKTEEDVIYEQDLKDIQESDMTFENEELFSYLLKTYNLETKEEVRKLKEVTIDSTLTNTNLNDLKYLQDLSSLTIKNMDIDLETINYNVNLQSLTIENAKVTHTASIPNGVETVNFSNVTMTDGYCIVPYFAKSVTYKECLFSVFHLKNAELLESFCFSGNGYLDLEEFEKCVNLKQITLEKCGNITNATVLANLSQLEEINLDDYAPCWLNLKTAESLNFNNKIDTLEEIEALESLIDNLTPSYGLNEEEKIKVFINYIVDTLTEDRIPTKVLNGISSRHYYYQMQPIYNFVIKKDKLTTGANFNYIAKALFTQSGIEAKIETNGEDLWLNVSGRKIDIVNYSRFHKYNLFVDLIYSSFDEFSYEEEKIEPNRGPLSPYYEKEYKIEKRDLTNNQKSSLALTIIGESLLLLILYGIEKDPLLKKKMKIIWRTLREEVEGLDDLIYENAFYELYEAIKVNVDVLVEEAKKEEMEGKHVEDNLLDRKDVFCTMATNISTMIIKVLQRYGIHYKGKPEETQLVLSVAKGVEELIENTTSVKDSEEKKYTLLGLIEDNLFKELESLLKRRQDVPSFEKDPSINDLVNRLKKDIQENGNKEKQRLTKEQKNAWEIVQRIVNSKPNIEIPSATLPIIPPNNLEENDAKKTMLEIKTIREESQKQEQWIKESFASSIRAQKERLDDIFEEKKAILENKLIKELAENPKVDKKVIQFLVENPHLAEAIHIEKIIKAFKKQELIKEWLKKAGASIRQKELVSVITPFEKLLAKNFLDQIEQPYINKMENTYAYQELIRKTVEIATATRTPKQLPSVIIPCEALEQTKLETKEKLLPSVITPPKVGYQEIENLLEVVKETITETIRSTNSYGVLINKNPKEAVSPIFSEIKPSHYSTLKDNAKMAVEKKKEEIITSDTILKKGLKIQPENSGEVSTSLQASQDNGVKQKPDKQTKASKTTKKKKTTTKKKKPTTKKSSKSDTKQRKTEKIAQEIQQSTQAVQITEPLTELFYTKRFWATYNNLKWYKEVNDISRPKQLPSITLSVEEIMQRIPVLKSKMRVFYITQFIAEYQNRFNTNGYVSTHALPSIPVLEQIIEEVIVPQDKQSDDLLVPIEALDKSKILEEVPSDDSNLSQAIIKVKELESEDDLNNRTSATLSTDYEYILVYSGPKGDKYVSLAAVFKEVLKQRCNYLVKEARAANHTLKNPRNFVNLKPGIRDENTAEVQLASDVADLSSATASRLASITNQPLNFQRAQESSIASMLERFDREIKSSNDFLGRIDAPKTDIEQIKITLTKDWKPVKDSLISLIESAVNTQIATELKGLSFSFESQGKQVEYQATVLDEIKSSIHKMVEAQKASQLKVVKMEKLLTVYDILAEKDNIDKMNDKYLKISDQVDLVLHKTEYQLKALSNLLEHTKEEGLGSKDMKKVTKKTTTGQSDFKKRFEELDEEFELPFISLLLGKEDSSLDEYEDKDDFEEYDEESVEDLKRADPNQQEKEGEIMGDLQKQESQINAAIEKEQNVLAAGVQEIMDEEEQAREFMKKLEKDIEYLRRLMLIPPKEMTIYLQEDLALEIINAKEYLKQISNLEFAVTEEIKIMKEEIEKIIAQYETRKSTIDHTVQINQSIEMETIASVENETYSNIEEKGSFSEKPFLEDVTVYHQETFTSDSTEENLNMAEIEDLINSITSLMKEMDAGKYKSMYEQTAKDMLASKIEEAHQMLTNLKNIKGKSTSTIYQPQEKLLIETITKYEDWLVLNSSNEEQLVAIPVEEEEENSLSESFLLNVENLIDSIDTLMRVVDENNDPIYIQKLADQIEEARQIFASLEEKEESIYKIQMVREELTRIIKSYEDWLELKNKEEEENKKIVRELESYIGSLKSALSILEDENRNPDAEVIVRWCYMEPVYEYLLELQKKQRIYTSEIQGLQEKVENSLSSLENILKETAAEEQAEELEKLKNRLEHVESLMSATAEKNHLSTYDQLLINEIDWIRTYLDNNANAENTSDSEVQIINEKIKEILRKYDDRLKLNVQSYQSGSPVKEQEEIKGNNSDAFNTGRRDEDMDELLSKEELDRLFEEWTNTGSKEDVSDSLDATSEQYGDEGESREESKPLPLAEESAEERDFSSQESLGEQQEVQQINDMNLEDRILSSIMDSMNGTQNEGSQQKKSAQKEEPRDENPNSVSLKNRTFANVIVSMNGTQNESSQQKESTQKEESRDENPNSVSLKNRTFASIIASMNSTPSTASKRDMLEMQRDIIQALMDRQGVKALMDRQGVKLSKRM